MPPHMEAAREINAAWEKCMDGASVKYSCPSDDQVAQIIRKYFPVTEEE